MSGICLAGLDLDLASLNLPYGHLCLPVHHIGICRWGKRVHIETSDFDFNFQRFSEHLYRCLVMGLGLDLDLFFLPMRNKIGLLVDVSDTRSSLVWLIARYIYNIYLTVLSTIHTSRTEEEWNKQKRNWSGTCYISNLILSDFLPSFLILVYWSQIQSNPVLCR